MKLNKNNKIFILAGETSGDYIGSCIMRGVKQYNNNINFVGVGGSFMENEGLSSLYNIKEFNVIGFLNTVVKIKKCNELGFSAIVLSSKGTLVTEIDIVKTYLKKNKFCIFAI